MAGDVDAGGLDVQRVVDRRVEIIVGELVGDEAVAEVEGDGEAALLVGALAVLSLLVERTTNALMRR
ncbi:hypothetical protein [Sphingomonas sanxanigenens]|uniref:Uncharacterized protein n=1 Tax=Sphingomonas sanxanigenens DSM 19645 = NX02 TaxID=1123269 RepID=W0ABM4_9SPHN|nr:hypothetical protein [Sphingomonas sanxanigenens]AHE53055.1 hypothetical protein NX02_06625 [Sphingomonas sanxanigenens DSM 19645 = NX02]